MCKRVVLALEGRGLVRLWSETTERLVHFEGGRWVATTRRYSGVRIERDYAVTAEGCRALAG